MTMGEKIAKLRKDNNLTQEQLAELLQVSRQAVSKWESDAAFPDTKKLILLSKKFSCSLDYLLKEEIETLEPEIENKDSKNAYEKSMILALLSFAPIFGIFIGIMSVRFQRKNYHSRKFLILSVIGMAVSVGLTAAMVIGAVLGL